MALTPLVAKVPVWIVVPPVYVFAPLRFSVPPFTVRPSVPLPLEMTPLKVPPPVTVSVGVEPAKESVTAPLPGQRPSSSSSARNVERRPVEIAGATR